MKKLLTACTVLLAAAVTAIAGEYEDISIEELSAAIEKGEVIVLDVNGSKSFAAGHIPGAIDYRANAAKIAEVLPADAKDKLVVAYCGGPSCRAYKAGAKAAEDLGFTNVKHLSAGKSGWVAAGKPVEAADSDS